MTETIVNQIFDESYPSLCIPRVFNNISEDKIRQVFNDISLGKIRRIDIVARKNEKGEPFKRVYIHFESWHSNDSAVAARRKIISGKEIKIVYDNPWFWKVSINKWQSSDDNASKREQNVPNKRPYVIIDETESGLNNVTNQKPDIRVKRYQNTNKPIQLKKKAIVKSNTQVGQELNPNAVVFEPEK